MSHTRRNHFNYNYAALSFAALGHSSADVGGLDFSTDHLLAVGVGDYENVNLPLRFVNRSATRLHGRNLSSIEFSMKIVNITKASPHPTRVALAPPSVSWFWLGSETGWTLSLIVNGLVTCDGFDIKNSTML
jgi:hypothetical protein